MCIPNKSLGAVAVDDPGTPLSRVELLIPGTALTNAMLFPKVVVAQCRLPHLSVPIQRSTIMAVQMSVTAHGHSYFI